MSDGNVYPTMVRRERGGAQSSGCVMEGLSVGMIGAVGILTPGVAVGVLVGVKVGVAELVGVEVAVTVDVWVAVKVGVVVGVFVGV